MGRYSEYNDGSEIAGCASAWNCCAFILLLFACCSPYVISGFYSFSPNSYVTISMGPFVAGTAYSTYYVYPYYYMSGSWLTWSEVASYNPCASDNANTIAWTKQVACCNENNEYQQPSAVNSNQAFAILSVIFSCFAAMATLAVSADGNKRMYGVALCNTWIACIFTIVSFALWTTWDYSVSCRSPGGCYIAFEAFANNTNEIGAFQFQYPLYYSGGFACAVTAYIMLQIAALMLCAGSKSIGKDVDTANV